MQARDLGPWDFELNIFINNKHSKPPQMSPNDVPTTYMFTLKLSYLANRTLSIINNTKSVVAVTPTIDENALKAHIEGGACIHQPPTAGDSLDYLLKGRLQSLWTLKQTITCHGGRGFDLVSKGETFRLRTANCVHRGTFKGLLVEIEHLDANADELDLISRFTRSLGLIRELVDSKGFPRGALSYNVLSETKLDPLSDLCQQYCDALQL